MSVQYDIIPKIGSVMLMINNFEKFFFSPMPPPVLMNFVVFPPGCGDSVANF